MGSLAPLSLTSTDLSSGNVKAYRTWFENGRWQGDLIEYEVSDQGALSTGIDLSGASPSDTGALPDTWSANVQFAVAETANAAYWNTGREILTRNGANQVAFRWGNLSDAQKAALDQSAFDDGAAGSNILNFVRGKRTDEFPDGPLRTRSSALGDLIHSNPVYVAKPRANFTSNGYASFVEDNANREPRIYVGANDGMLHAFDAATGNEEWAYIPSLLIPRLKQTTARPYLHQYYVDGQLTVQDTFFGNDWHTVLVGGLGAGGKGWFGLDITSPTYDESGNADKILWELDASSDDDLGDAFGQAVISKLNDGNWYAVIGNGYNSVNGVAKLYLVNVANGNITRISTESGSAISPNGLSSPTLVDTNGNGTADIVYAGDIDGNMWKFDLSGDNTADWEVAYAGKPLHEGLASQPVIQPPDVSRHPITGHIVMFGTGRLFTGADLEDASVQALYGIWDTGNDPADADEQSLLTQSLSGDQAYSSGAINEVVQTFDQDPGPIDWNNDDGWKVELPAGVRVLQPPQLRAGRLKVTVSNPITRANYLIEPYYLDGGSPGQTIFDLNRSSSLSTADNVDGNDDGDLGDREDVPVMWQRETGIMSRPTIARIASGIDTQLINFLVPPPGIACVGECPNGFQGAHIDVDTDYFNNADGGTGDKTHKHTHRYDKTVGRVYVDYLDLLVAGQVELDDTSLIPGDTEFIIVVANADLSPGSTLTVGNVEYNVVEYQAMVHRRLRAWDGIGDLTDDMGNSLIYTANELVANAGTVRHSFNELSILQGALHSTETNCVINDNAVTNGRYRNGALVTQAISRSIFTGGGNMLDKLIVQNPSDLQSPVTLANGAEISLKEDFDNSSSIDPANYEVFGGLRAANTGQGVTDGLFESTLFWHAEKQFSLPCYGAAGYDQVLASMIDTLMFTQEEFDALLAENNVVDLASEILASQDCKDIDEADGGCKARFATLEWLLSLEATIFKESQLDPTGLNPNQDLPVIMEGSADDQGISAGPNFAAGRRTWVDIIAD